jgi:hypothetical protein
MPAGARVITLNFKEPGPDMTLGGAHMDYV